MEHRRVYKIERKKCIYVIYGEDSHGGNNRVGKGTGMNVGVRTTGG